MPRLAKNASNWKSCDAALKKSRSTWASAHGSAKTFMSALDFLDSNVLIYGFDVSQPRKREIAQQLIQDAFAGKAVISSQVLAEFCSTFLHKALHKATP